MRTRAPAVEVSADAGALAHAAAERFVVEAEAAVRARGRFTVALAGGTTPNAMYRLLASRYRDAVPWDAIDFFWGDERHVPPTHRDSNVRAAYDAMLGSVPTPPARVHRIRGELPDASDAATDYEQTLRREFASPPGKVPTFDLVLLGMGSDGHTASLFPGSEALLERERLVLAPWVDHLRSHRITLTLAVLNHATLVVFLVSGRAKADSLRDVVEGPDRPGQLPAQLVRPINGRSLWLVDREAATQLTRSRDH